MTKRCALSLSSVGWGNCRTLLGGKVGLIPCELTQRTESVHQDRNPPILQAPLERCHPAASKRTLVAANPPDVEQKAVSAQPAQPRKTLLRNTLTYQHVPQVGYLYSSITGNCVS